MASVSILFFVGILYFLNIFFMKSAFLESKSSEITKYSFLDSKKLKIIKYLLAILLFCIAYFVPMPMCDGFSLVILCYSLFDSTSLFCMFLLLFLFFRIVFRDFCGFELRELWCNYIASGFKIHGVQDATAKREDYKNSKNIKEDLDPTNLDSMHSNLCVNTQNCKSRPSADTRYALFFIALCIYGFILYGHTFGILDFDLYHADIFTQSIFVFLLVSIIFLIDRIFGIICLITSIFYSFYFLKYNILEFFICPYLWIFSVLYIAFYIFNFVRVSGQKNIK